MKNPKIRFKGFVDGWEERKLEDIVERVTRKNQNLVSELPLTISAQYGLIDQGEFFDKRVASKDVSGYYLIYNGEFAYNKSTSNDAPWGAIKRLDRYKDGVLSTLYIVFRIKNEDIISSDFMATYFDTSNWHMDIQAIAAEGARNHGLLNIAPIDFFKMELKIPQDIEEQQKIGDYFKSLNNLITLHQRKYEETKTLKKYMFQKMFPQNGSNIPEIRFDGFTNAWEQRKICDMSETTYGGGTPKTAIKEYWNGDIPWIQSSDIVEHDVLNVSPRRYISYDAIKNSAAKIIPKNSLAIVTRVGVGKLAIMPFEYASSQDFLSLSNLNTDINFTAYALYNKLQNEMNALQGTSIKGITKEEVLNKELCVPNLEEQQKVSMYFTNLDHLITLHQRKRNELQNIKKFMLQNMFI